jgi:energy-coupling factor transporter ATP-binding protein EcfA2
MEATERMQAKHETNLTTTQTGRRRRNLAAEIRLYVEEAQSTIVVAQVDQDLGITPEEKSNRKKVMSRLVNERVLVNTGRGRYDKVMTDAGWDSWDAPQKQHLDIRWPLEIEQLGRVSPGDIVVVAGETGAGKTAFFTTFVALNDERLGDRICYFSSEFGIDHFKERLAGHGSIEQFKTRRFRYIGGAVDPGSFIRPGLVNILDYLEAVDKFYQQIGEPLQKIHKQLAGEGAALVAIQKKTGERNGRGGDFSREKATLYITLSVINDSKDSRECEAEITKARDWAQNDVNPIGMRRRYTIVEQSTIVPLGPWYRDDERQYYTEEE